MTSNELNTYADFAIKFNLTINEARLLPSMFETAAKKIGTRSFELLKNATYANNEAGEYLAGLVRKVASTI